MALLCEEMLSSVRVTDKRDWDDLYSKLYGSPPKSDKQWRNIDAIVRRLNQGLAKKHIPPILKFDGGEAGVVTRLK